MLTTEFKQRIVAEINEVQRNYTSGTKLAVALGINKAQLSRIKKGELDGVLSDANWISIARKLGVENGEQSELVIAKTQVFNYIYQQLSVCQRLGLSGVLCDLPDIGKTTAAKVYVKENKYAVRIDCSQCKSKQRFIRLIAREFGINHSGKYAEVYDDLTYYLKGIPNPIIILDEAGDLDYYAFLEIKALWNATEGYCGWYMMGADGLKRKMERSVDNKKVGYAEIFSRFGAKFQRITPDEKEDRENFIRKEVAVIVKANDPSVNSQLIYAHTLGSLRRIKIELKKHKKQ